MITADSVKEFPEPFKRTAHFVFCVRLRVYVLKKHEKTPQNVDLYTSKNPLFQEKYLAKATCWLQGKFIKTHCHFSLESIIILAPSTPLTCFCKATHKSSVP